MSDFASSAMLRVLHAGMRRLGLASPAQAWLKSAKVPLDAKRQLVGQVLAQRGWVGVLKLGEGVQDVQGEVLMDYLAASAKPQHILQAWLRLERYVHSRHRLRLTYESPHQVQMHHHSVVENQKPTAAEDVVVLGVLLGLLQRCGLGHLQFSWGSSQQWWDWGSGQNMETALEQTLASKETARWRIRWIQLPDSDSSKPVELTHEDEVSGGAWSREVAVWIKRQLILSRVEALNLNDVAQELSISERSLQRHLQAEGLRFVDVLGQTRVKLAAERLQLSPAALAEIGFSCGFSDQAHFCREFKRRVGVSPQQFRDQAKLGK